MGKMTYHPLSKFLHWIMFILIALALAVMEVRGDIPKGDPLRDNLRNRHILA
jgi:cytochrome b561